MPLVTGLKITILVSAIVAVVALAVVVAAPFPGKTLEMLAAGSGAVAVHAVIVLGMLTAIERGKAVGWMRVGLVLAIAGLAAWLAYRWTSLARGRGEMLVLQIATVLTGWSTLLMIAGVALCQPANRVLARAVQRATVVMVALMVLMLPAIWWLLEEPFRYSDNVLRIFPVLAILAVTGLALNMMMARVSGLSEHDEPADGAPQVTVTCPRCAVKQAIRLNGDRCAACGLRIKVQMP